MSAQGVFTPDFRLKFVDGEITTGSPSPGLVACGEGTEHPMEATLDQIAEIFYRVKDAWFTEGSIEIDSGGGWLIPFLASATEASVKRSEAIPATYDFNPSYLQRGYTTQLVGGSVSAHNSGYLGEEYNRGDGEMFRDIFDNERGMWLRGSEEAGSIVFPWWTRSAPYGALPFIEPFEFGYYGFGNITCAFSYFCENGFRLISSPDPNSPPRYFRGSNDGCTVAVRFNGQIGVVKTSPLNGMLDPSNRFFIGVRLYARAIIPWPGFGPSDVVSTLKSELDEPPHIVGSFVNPCNYIIKLSSGEISAKIFYFLRTPPLSPGSVSGYDFIHEAKEWWPYSKDNPAAPVWDAATGAKL